MQLAVTTEIRPSRLGAVSGNREALQLSRTYDITHTAMLSNALVPDRDHARTPTQAHMELRCIHMIEKKPQQRVILLVRQPDQTLGVNGVDIQRFASRERIGDDGRMNTLLGLEKADSTVVIQRLHSLEQPLIARRKSVPRRIHTRPHRITTHFRDLE